VDKAIGGDMPDEATDKKAEMFSQACYNAWFSVSLEKLKQLVLVSSGAIGLMLAMRDSIISTISFYFWIFSIVSFSITLLVILFFSFENASTLIADEANDRSSSSRGAAKLLDTASVVFFSLGVLFAVLFVVFTMNYFKQ
jgi:hypothetical protein